MRSSPVITLKRQFGQAAALVIGLGLLSTVVRADTPAPVFAGTSSYVLVGTPDALQIPAGHPFTIEGWMKFSAFDSADMLYSKNAARTSPYSCMFGVRSSGALLTAYTGAGGSPANTWIDVTLSPALTTGLWYHVAFSYDGTTLSYYLNGALKGTNAFSFSNYTNHTIKIGGYATGTDVAGLTSDVRVWNQARTRSEILAFKDRRLTGQELGLLAYWPLNEGAGSNVFDRTPNTCTGALVSATWTNDAVLALQTAPTAFAYTSPFTLANLATGSARFTNSNEVDLAGLTVPAGYDQFQITESGDVSALGAWESTNAIPARSVFTQPVSTTNVSLYAWFTNSTGSVTLRRAEGGIVYTTNAPMPVVLAARTRELVPGYYVMVDPAELDNGSTGGAALGEAMGLYQRSLNLVAGPDSNSTPNEPYLTVASLGDYTVSLRVVNEAGNAATSTLTCALSVLPFSGGFVWSGAGSDDDWFRPENWMPIGLPGAGDTVRIDNGGTVLLTNETPVLGALWVTNATLTVSNWATAIRADTVTIGEAGVLTMTGAFTNNSMSNRVYVVCRDFSLLPGGVIDADGRGYDGGYGPSGAGTSTRYSGAGYGGRGSVNPQWGDSRYGRAYGTVAGPLQPGSGGCGVGLGGAGGGLVQIEAADTIALHGAIRANGNTGLPSRYNGPGGGSGGGVYLACRVFTGSRAGSISVRGGEGVKEKITPAAGRGGGGRVVILYEAASPWPGVSIDADVGASGIATETYGDSHTAQWGTLFVSDGSLLEGLTDLNTNTFAVRNVNLWIDGVTEWALASLTVTHAAFRFGDTNLVLKVAGALVVGAGGRLGASRIEAGTVTLANGGVLEVRAAATNGLSAWGGWLDVAGGLQIDSNATLRLFSDPVSGGAPRVRVHDLVVASGGLVDARAKGCMSARGPGAGSTASRRRGGGYGGAGAYGSITNASDGLPYGPAIGPLQSGSGGCYDGRGGDGGGLVHIEAAGGIALHGSITAQGGNALDSDDGQAGGGSGGGVFLACQTFIDGSEGTISAQGGSGRAAAGGGGGGRIVLWTGLTSERFQGFWRRAVNGETFPYATIETSALPRAFSGVFTNTILLSGGGPVNRTGEAGTFRWMPLREGTIVSVH